MITEDYVSFETAKLLKEKGFDEPCECLYDTENNDVAIVNGWMDTSNSELEEKEFASYSAPTLQMATKWLREVHQIFIRPNTSFLYPIRYYCEIFCYGDNLKTQQDITTENFESPEEACESAIKYCLENLV